MTDRRWLTDASTLSVAASPITGARARRGRPGRVWTARYSNKGIPTSGLVPVRITVGYPRFKLGYELVATLRELAPTWAMLALTSDADFTVAYSRQLDALGVDRVDELLDRVRRLAGADPLLLCFEDVRAGRLCHRRLFAAWYESKTGQSVPELDEEGGPIADAR